MSERCLACGAPLPDGGQYCPSKALSDSSWIKKGQRFQGCESIALETVYRARPEGKKMLTDLHHSGGVSKPMSDLERFHAAYGDDCSYSPYGPLPRVDEVRRYLTIDEVHA